MDTASQIVRERRHQLMKGYTVTHDDAHVGGELLLASLAYMCSPGEQIWPWDAQSYNPSNDPIENLVVAGAFLAAEGDRLIRRRQQGKPVVGGMVILGLGPEEMLATVDGLREIRSEMKNL